MPRKPKPPSRLPRDYDARERADFVRQTLDTTWDVIRQTFEPEHHRDAALLAESRATYWRETVDAETRQGGKKR